MRHYVHQLVATVVSLLSGAGQEVYSGFFRLFSLKTAVNEVDGGQTEPKQ